MLSPGGGAGARAAAEAKIAGVLDDLKEAMNGFDVESKEFQRLIRAISSLTQISGTKKADELRPAANLQNRAMAGRANPLQGAPPPGIQRPKPPMPTPATMPGGM